MPNQRSLDQKILAFTLDTRLSDIMDSTSASLGNNRSEFIRRAIINELKSMGIAVPASFGFAPDRRTSVVARVAESSDDNSQEIVQPAAKKKSVDYRKAVKANKARQKKANP